jgi:hypothetical protein
MECLKPKEFQLTMNEEVPRGDSATRVSTFDNKFLRRRERTVVAISINELHQ